MPNSGCLIEPLISSWFIQDFKNAPLKCLTGHNHVAGTLGGGGLKRIAGGEGENQVFSPPKHFWVLASAVAFFQGVFTGVCFIKCWAFGFP